MEPSQTSQDQNVSNTETQPVQHSNAVIYSFAGIMILLIALGLTVGVQYSKSLTQPDNTSNTIDEPFTSNSLITSDTRPDAPVLEQEADLSTPIQTITYQLTDTVPLIEITPDHHPALAGRQSQQLYLMNDEQTLISIGRKRYKDQNKELFETATLAPAQVRHAGEPIAPGTYRMVSVHVDELSKLEESSTSFGTPALIFHDCTLSAPNRISCPDNPAYESLLIETLVSDVTLSLIPYQPPLADNELLYFDFNLWPDMTDSCAADTKYLDCALYADYITAHRIPAEFDRQNEDRIEIDLFETGCRYGTEAGERIDWLYCSSTYYEISPMEIDETGLVTKSRDTKKHHCDFAIDRFTPYQGSGKSLYTGVAQHVSCEPVR